MVYNFLTTYCICIEENHYEYIHHMSTCTHLLVVVILWTLHSLEHIKVCTVQSHVICTSLLSVTSFMRRGLQCLLSKGLCGLGVMWRCNLILED